MTFKFKISLLLTLGLMIQASYGQTISKKDLVDKLNINLQVDSLKIGDTIVVKKGEKYNNFHFKSNTDLKQYNWYGRCGNKFILDYFRPKPSKWVRVGFWTLINDDNKTLLKMVMNEKPFIFQYVGRQEHYFKFIFLE